MTDQPNPTSNVVYPQSTVGISRNLWLDLVPAVDEPGPEGGTGGAEPFASGGGDQNGSTNTHLKGQAGTGAGKGQVGRALKFGGNYCGVT